MEGARAPVRIRLRVPLTLLPLVAGIAVAVPLWNDQAEPEFFSAATHVLAITAGALASGIVAFGVQALFGTPGMRESEPAN